MSISLYNLLFENKLDDIRAKLSGENLETFNNVLAINPQLPNKYWEWIAKNYINEEEYVPQEIYNLINNFDKVLRTNAAGLPSKDINNPIYNSIEKLELAVDKLARQKSNTQKKKAEKSDSKKIYEDSRYLLVQPLSTKASCHYGSGAKWCIAAKEEEHNLYKSYSSDGVKFIFIIDKEAENQDPLSKVAVAFVKKAGQTRHFEDAYEIYNSEDDKISINEFLSLYPQNILQTIKNYFALPLSMEEEAKRIQELSNEQFANVVITTLNSYEQKTSRYIQLGTLSQLAHLLNTYARNGKIFLNNNEKEIESYILDQVKTELLKRFNNQENEIIAALHSYGVTYENIIKLNFGIIPATAKDIVRELPTISDPEQIKVILTKNNQLLIREVVIEGYDYFNSIIINPDAFNTVRSIFNKIRPYMVDPQNEFVTDKTLANFKNAIKSAVKTSPAPRSISDISEYIKFLLLNNQLSNLQDANGKNYVLYNGEPTVYSIEELEENGYNPDSN